MQQLYGDYYRLILVLVGALVFLVIRFGSDSSVANAGVTVDIGDAEEHSIPEPASFFNGLRAAQDRNCGRFMVGGMALKAEELFAGRLPDGTESCAFCEIAVSLFATETSASRLADMIHPDKESAGPAFAARLAYDEFIYRGNLSIKPGYGIDMVLRRNCVLISNISERGLNRKGDIRIAAFCPDVAQVSSLESRKLVFSRGNGSLLLLSNTGNFGVMIC